MFPVLIWLCITTCVLGSLPLCDLFSDRFGKWMNTSDLRNGATYKDVNDHFIFGGPREATEFSKIWIPDHCAVHRFTAKSIHNIVDHLVSKTEPRTSFHVSVISDSALRGILCGIMRILSGSELIGPLQTDICGHNGRSDAVSVDQLNIPHFDKFGSNLTFSFTYVQMLSNPKTVAHLKAVIALKPNVCAWDFNSYYKVHPDEYATNECTTPESEAISLLRVSGIAKDGLLDAGVLAERLGVRLIYRTTHYNRRYGPTCGDGRVVKLLENTHWEVWDNAAMSKDVWKTQCEDGFHFDRNYIHTAEAHMELLSKAFEKHLELPGMLEIQLAQSLLFNLFHSTLKEYVNAGLQL